MILARALLKIKLQALETTETKFQKRFRITTGVLMALQTLIFFFVAAFLLFFILFMGGLATVAGGGNVTEEQFINTWWMIGFMATYPEFVMILMIIATVQIFIRRRPIFIVITCLLFILPYLGMAYLMLQNEETKREFSSLAFLPILIPMAAIFVAFQMKKKSLNP